MKESYIYILTNKNRTVFYTGVTANLSARMSSHLEGNGSVFCKKYNIRELIYYELFMDITDAIRREKEIKGWSREKKLNLVKKRNPELRDLLERGKGPSVRSG
ncbi:MAG TPA: GIY-YIG nuclease family protein [Bacteroidales bacterium]|nr:GIY-YIG nuclease family protein [Bacteroidales bacterium]